MRKCHAFYQAILLCVGLGMDVSYADETEQKKQSTSTKPGTYIQQAPVLDSVTKASSMPPVAPSPRIFTSDGERDAAFLDTLSVQGWEAKAGSSIHLAENQLLNSDNKPIEEIARKPSSVLIEYGCSNVTEKQFKRGHRVCTVYLLRFKTSDGAFGAYSTMREGSSTFIARGDGSSEDERSITFHSAKFLLILDSSEEDDDEAKEVLIKLADKITSLIPTKQAESKEPKVIAALPHFERLKGSERYFMGSKSAMHYSNVPFIESLNLDHSQGAAYADYAYSRPIAERLKLLLTEYSNSGTAQNTFNTYAENMASLSKKTVQRGNNELICKMSDSYLMCGTSGSRVYVITGARKATSPNILARELRNSF